MESMYGNEYGIIVLVRDLDDFMYTPLVVTHPHQTSEYAYSVIYMDHIVSYIEGIKVIYSQLLALLDGTSYAYSLETVEYLMIGIAAYLVLGIDESLMDGLSGNEFWNKTAVLRQNGLDTFELRSLVSVYENLISALDPASHIRGKKLEILVE